MNEIDYLRQEAAAARALRVKRWYSLPKELRVKLASTQMMSLEQYEEYLGIRTPGLPGSKESV